MSANICTYYPFYPEDDQGPFTLAFTSDTQTSQTVVPIFLIHSVTSPFCNNPDCVCQQNRQQKNALLVSIAQGNMMLQRVEVQA